MAGHKKTARAKAGADRIALAVWEYSPRARKLIQIGAETDSQTRKLPPQCQMAAADPRVSGSAG
jgi:hypothetical protein